MNNTHPLFRRCVVASSRRAGSRGATFVKPSLTSCQHLNPFSTSTPALDRAPPLYDGHIPLSWFERVALTVGSGVVSFMNPRRGAVHQIIKDLIAAFGELTSQPFFLDRLRDVMLSNPTGRRILRDRPRISSATMPRSYLASLAPTTVGGAYHAWLEREKLEQDSRTPVHFVDDEECAYVMTRYREGHDFYHALTGLPTVREGEVALKLFEFCNTLLPMTGLASLSVATLKPAERERFWAIYGPWAVRNGLAGQDVINVYWEEELETDAGELRARLGIESPPDMRDLRKVMRERRKAERAASGVK